MAYRFKDGKLEKIEEVTRPKIRPRSEPKKRKGGLGSNKGAAKYKRTSAEDRRKANTDGRFGYFDEVNKRYVPAFIDAMDGGGRDTRGDTFKGGMYSELLNDLGVKPYGSQRERMFGGPTTSPNVDTVSGSIPRPRVRPAQTIPDELIGVPFNNTPPTVPDELIGVPFNNTPPTVPDEVSGVPFNNTPNPFAGSTYDMPMQRPVDPSMSFGQQPAGSMPRMSFGQQPVGYMPERAKRQIVPNPDYAVSVQELIDYLQSNKGFMGADNAIDDYETMLLTGRYPRG